MSTIKVINAIHPSGTTNNIVNDSSGNVTVGNNLTVTGTATVAGTSVVAVAPGTSGNVLTSNGSAWTSSAPTSTGINVQTFTSSGTWTKPAYSASSRVLIQCWGAGGSGAKGTGGGGGGGGYNERWLTLSSMGATETITVGAGGTAISAVNTDGNVGGNTTAGSWVTAYGGGGGGTSSSGGGGGGQLSAGNTGTSNPPNPGRPLIVTTVDFGNTIVGYAGSGGGSSTNSPSQQGLIGFIHGGGGGGGNAAGVGGNSVWGGGGGGGGNGNYAGGTSNFGGNGGAGSTSGTASAGTQPGGGGGGTFNGTASGAGAAGQVIITVFPA